MVPGLRALRVHQPEATLPSPRHVRTVPESDERLLLADQQELLVGAIEDSKVSDPAEALRETDLQPDPVAAHAEEEVEEGEAVRAGGVVDSAENHKADKEHKLPDREAAEAQLLPNPVQVPPGKPKLDGQPREQEARP